MQNDEECRGKRSLQLAANPVNVKGAPDKLATDPASPRMLPKPKELAPEARPLTVVVSAAARAERSCDCPATS